MRKFIFDISLFFILLLIVLSILTCGCWCWILTHPAQFYTHSNANIRMGQEKMCHKSTPSIILIGGSNCAFGFDSKLIVDALHMPVINTGVSAGIGLYTQTQMVLPYVSKGDIIIICPEYEQFTSLLYGDETLLLAISSNDKDLFHLLSLKQIIYLSQYLPSAIKDIVSARVWFNESNNDDYAPYWDTCVNEYGDNAAWGKRLHHNFPSEGRLEPSNIDKESVRYIKTFIKDIHSKSAECLLLPPVYRDEEFHENIDVIEKLTERLEKNGTPFISHPINYVVPDSLCFDSRYHLTHEGAILRTQQVINDIIPYMH